MHNAQHTPGPWTANEGPHVIRGPKRIVIAKLLDSHEPYDVKAANASLIAAAPAMYTELRAAFELLIDMRNLASMPPAYQAIIQKQLHTIQATMHHAEGS